MQNSFYSEKELLAIGFKTIGTNVKVSRFARFYGPENMEMGNNIRIDDFCIFSGDIKIGSNVHVSAYCALYGKFGIKLSDYVGLSTRCTLYSAIDDFSGEFLIGPLVKEEYRNIISGLVEINKYSQLGCNCVVFPGITIEEGVAVGAMSLINKNLESWNIYAGIPARFMKERSKKLINYL